MKLTGWRLLGEKEALSYQLVGTLWQMRRTGQHPCLRVHEPCSLRAREACGGRATNGSLKAEALMGEVGQHLSGAWLYISIGPPIQR